MLISDTYVGVHKRRTADSRKVGIRFTDAAKFPDFAAVPIISAIITQDPPGSVVIGSAVVSVTNVVSFRISGGTAGVRVRVDVTATNGTDTKTESLIVQTDR